MTVQAIRPGGEVVAALGRADEAVEAVASVPGGSLSDDELMRAVERSWVLENRVAALQRSPALRGGA